MTVRRTHPPTRVMRENPDIDQLRRQARELLEAYRAQSPDAVLEVDAYHRTATPDTFALHDAQFVLARSYGFESWPKLKAAVEGVTTKRLHEAVKKGDLGAVRALLARRPEIVDLLPGGPSGSEIRALHIAVMARDVEMTRLLLEAGADTRDGIWPNRDATSPRTIAEERGYDEIVALMTAHEEKRGARSVDAHDNGVRRLRDAMMTGGEEAVIAVFESEPTLAGMCPPHGVTMLHRATQYGLLRVATWLLDHGADVNKPSQLDFWRWKGRTPLEFAVWECIADADRSTREAMAALLIERGAELTPLAAAALGRWDYLASCAPDSLQGKAVLQAAVRGDRPDVLRRLLDVGLDPNERMQLGQLEEQTFSSGGPLLEAVNTFANSTSGVYLTSTLFPRLGIAADMKPKSTTVGAAAVVRGDVEIAIQPVSELLPVPGLDFVGMIPSEVQKVNVYAAAIVAGSVELDKSRRLIAFLASDRAATAIKKSGMEQSQRR
jgi:ankyrin repeat protein